MELITDFPAEELSRYCPGGFHPIHINDMLGGRFKIVHKLGFGSFATVWLAWDTVQRRNVTVKVVVADKSSESHHELKILQHLGTSDSNHSGFAHVIRLLEFFYVTGPNGRHLCLVFNILGPTVCSILETSRWNGMLARKVATQLLWAVVYLHEMGIAHGDIHARNILFHIPELEHVDIAKTFGSPVISAVRHKDGKALSNHTPKHIVHPVTYTNLKDLQFGDIQLIDFGESFFIGTPAKAIVTLLSNQPPELVFHRGLSEKVDIWELGCTIYELVMGRSLFECFWGGFPISQFLAIVGDIPSLWITDDRIIETLGKCDRLALENDVMTTYHNQKQYSQQKYSLEDSLLEHLANCLRKMLVIDPEQREPLKNLLDHPWFLTRERS